MAGSLMITQRDEVKEPQGISEGLTVATYGVTPANPNFIAPGQDSVLVEGSDPTVAEKRIPGDVDRQEVTKTREKNTTTLKFKVLTASESYLAWAMNKPVFPVIIDTPDESKTFINSYNDDSGTESFIAYKGCKPQSYTLTIDNEGYIAMEIVMSCKTIVEDATGPTLGTGSYATPLAGTPLTHVDGGVGAFVYDSVATEQKGFTVSGSYAESVHDPSGGVLDLFRRPTQRVITGSVTTFKKDGTLQGNARLVTPKAGVYTVDTGQIVLTFTNFLFKPSGEESSGDTSEATMESKNYEAKALAVA